MRKLYAGYYFVVTLGNTIAVAVCIGSIKAFVRPPLDKLTSEMETNFEGIARNLGIIVLISCILSTLLLSMGKVSDALPYRNVTWYNVTSAPRLFL